MYRTKDEANKQNYWYHHVFLAGCCGGVLKAIVACPIELTKVRLQVRVSKFNNQLYSITYNSNNQYIKIR